MDTKNFNVGRRDRAQRPRYGAEVDEYGFELEQNIADTPQDEPTVQDLESRDMQFEAELIGDGQDDYGESKKPGFFARLFGRREQSEYDEYEEYDEDEYGDEAQEQLREPEPEPPVREQRHKREKRGRERRVEEELPEELPQESAHPVLTFIVPREQLPNLSRLTPLGAPARRRTAAVKDEPAAKPEFLPPAVPIPEPEPVFEPEPIYDAEPEPVLEPEPIYDAEPEPAFEPVPIYDAEPEPVYDAEPLYEERYEEPIKPRMSRREQRRRRRAHRFKLMVAFSHIRGVDTLTPYGKPISQKNRARIAVPAMAAPPMADDYRVNEPIYAPEPACEPELTPQQAVTEEPELDDEDDGLSLPINEGFGFAPVPEQAPPVRERPKKKRLHYALGDRRISPQLARRLKPYTLPPVESAPPKRERTSVRERAARRKPQRRGRNEY